jgi:hypothetical protein
MLPQLETDDRAYEAERKKRMKSRRLRFRGRGELSRKTAMEVKRILEAVGLTAQVGGQ